MLVCTTIIETGLDISNANTIVIDRADKYGLSQLHQLRGRVGRARERAYAYFLYDDMKPLSETAADRLETIAVNNDLGSGMQVALKDLELRGAGNLLGAEQAGHIAGVGFDLYLRMIGEAVATFRGDDVEGPTELRLELPVRARIPESYIDSERLRLEAYQKLSSAATATAAADAIDLVVEELRDRYGEPPAEVTGIVAVARLRRRAARVGADGCRRDGTEPARRSGASAGLVARTDAAALPRRQAHVGRRGARRADAAVGHRRAAGRRADRLDRTVADGAVPRARCPRPRPPMRHRSPRPRHPPDRSPRPAARECLFAARGCPFPARGCPFRQPE